LQQVPVENLCSQVGYIWFAALASPSAPQRISIYGVVAISLPPD